MINLKELYTNAPELFERIFDNTNIKIYGANDKADVIEKLNDPNTRYIGVRSEFKDHVSLFEYDNTNHDEADEFFGISNNIDDVTETLNATINDSKLLNKAISIGNKLPVRMEISEAYNENILKIMKKYGQGLKNCYDYLVSKTL